MAHSRTTAKTCSIYSARADLHDSITRQPGSFEKSLAGITKLRDRGVPVAIKTPLMASTAPGWREVVALATGLGCESQFDLNITARNDGDLGPVHHRVQEEAVIADIPRDAFPPSSSVTNAPGSTLDRTQRLSSVAPALPALPSRRTAL